MAHPLDKIEPGIKVTAQMSPEPTDEDLEFTRALGVTHAVLWTDATKSSYEYYASRRELFEKAGITVYGFGFSYSTPVNVIIIGGEGVSATDYQLLANPTPTEIEMLTATVPANAAIGPSPVTVTVYDNTSNADVIFDVTP